MQFLASILYMRSLTLALILLASSGCESILGSSPTISGVIVSEDVDVNGYGPFAVHVKESLTAECGIIFKVWPGTDVWRSGGPARPTPASIADLTIGRRVRVWSDIVLTSCPGQSLAEGIEVLD
jgi:hypothetical protein